MNEKGMFVFYNQLGDVDTVTIHNCTLKKEIEGGVVCNCGDRFDDFYNTEEGKRNVY